MPARNGLVRDINGLQNQKAHAWFERTTKIAPRFRPPIRSCFYNELRNRYKTSVWFAAHIQYRKRINPANLSLLVLHFIALRNVRNRTAGWLRWICGNFGGPRGIRSHQHNSDMCFDAWSSSFFNRSSPQNTEEKNSRQFTSIK
jgi:hypothetical protein